MDGMGKPPRQKFVDFGSWLFHDSFGHSYTSNWRQKDVGLLLVDSCKFAWCTQLAENVDCNSYQQLQNRSETYLSCVNKFPCFLDTRTHLACRSNYSSPIWLIQSYFLRKLLALRRHLKVMKTCDNLMKRGGCHHTKPRIPRCQASNWGHVTPHFGHHLLLQLLITSSK